ATIPSVEGRRGFWALHVRNTPEAPGSGGIPTRPAEITPSQAARLAEGVSLTAPHCPSPMSNSACREAPAVYAHLGYALLARGRSAPASSISVLILTSRGIYAWRETSSTVFQLFPS